MTRRLVLGTRGSALARRQADIVIESLRGAAPGVELEARIIHTEGDRRQDVSLEAIGGEGVFVKDIERRLLDREIDLAVHSLKDMPAATPPGLTIGAVLARGDARDVLVSRRGQQLQELPRWPCIGTDSRRRVVQLLAIRPDFTPTSIRGNVDTRLAKVAAGEYDAIVLAAAGLERLGLLERVTQFFSVEHLLPAVGQAVLAVECRADDVETLDLLRGVEDAATRIAITAERAFLERLSAGCRLPVGAYGELDGAVLRLRGLVADERGNPHRAELSGPTADAQRLGAALAERLAAEAGLALSPVDQNPAHP